MLSQFKLTFVQFSHEIGRVDVQNRLFVRVLFICGWSSVIFQSISTVGLIKFNLSNGICPIFTRVWPSYCSKSTLCPSFVHLRPICCRFWINFNCWVNWIQFEHRHLPNFHIISNISTEIGRVVAQNWLYSSVSLICGWLFVVFKKKINF